MRWITPVGLLGLLAACDLGDDSLAMDTGAETMDSTMAGDSDSAAPSSASAPSIRSRRSATSPKLKSKQRASKPVAAHASPARAPATPSVLPPTSLAAEPSVVVLMSSPVAEPPVLCEVYQGDGCYWMENTSGNFCWVPWEGRDMGTCKRLDSCDGGGGVSGGGCYKWSDSSSGTRAPWPSVPVLEIPGGLYDSDEMTQPGHGESADEAEEDWDSYDDEEIGC